MNLLPIFATIATIAGGLGIAYAVFTSARVQSTINLYKEENTAQGKRISTLETETRVAQEKLTALQRENDMLRDLATGRTAVEALSREIRDAEAQRKDEHVEIVRLLTAIRDRLSQ